MDTVRMVDGLRLAYCPVCGHEPIALQQHPSSLLPYSFFCNNAPRRPYHVMVYGGWRKTVIEAAEAWNEAFMRHTGMLVGLGNSRIRRQLSPHGKRFFRRVRRWRQAQMPSPLRVYFSPAANRRLFGEREAGQ